MDEMIRELSSNNMQSDNLPQLTNISKMMLEKSNLLKKGIPDIT